MGVLGATTVQKLQDYSELPEVYGKDPEKLQSYIDRAEAIISRTGTLDKTLPGCEANLELAANMLAENLIILGTVDYRRSAAANLRSETIGSYSYSRGESKGNNDNNGLTSEILSLLGACRIEAQGFKYHRTNVFVPRTVIAVGGEHDDYVVPDDGRVEEIATGLEVIPKDPRQ